MAYDEAIDSILGETSATRMGVVGDIDANPDDAARALELSQSTGVPASVIHGDLENFERTHKATLAASIVQSNSYISDLVARDPMVAKLSNDDYGQLDAVSQSVTKIGPKSGLGRVFEATKAGFDPEGLQTEIGKTIDFLPGADATQKSLAAFGLGPLIGGALSVDLMGRAINAGIYGLSAGVAEARRAFGDPEADANADRLMRDLIIGGQLLLNAEGTARPIGGAVPKELNRLAEMAQKVEPWIIEGKEPPRFIDKDIDAVKYQQNQVDLKNLDEALKQAQSSATKERNPEIFASFIRQHTDAKIGLSGDAVAKLYGDKLPTPDDGLLGWAPNIADQLETARITGGDVHIPLADWLAKVDPEIAKELRDDTRVRPGGITKIEKEVLAETELPDNILPEHPLEAIRDGSHLEPLFQHPERKLEVKRAAQDSVFTGVMGEGEHGFEFVDEKGKVRGWIHLTERNGGKDLYVEYIGGVAGEGPTSYGPRLVRDLLKQIKEQFPNAETLGGYRVTGAREAVGKINETMVKLDTPEGVAEFRRIAEDSGKRYRVSGAVETVIPNELKGKELELANAITEELNRIVPKQVTHAPASEITFQGRPQHGIYQPFRDKFPILLWSLASDDPRSTARHEALHHLRQQGFLSLNEWRSLQEAAQKEGWLGKYDIDARYFDLGEGAKLEEAIAEAFGEWRSGKLPADGHVAKAFEKIKELLDRVAHRVKEFLGRDLTPEEIFKMIDQGIVGRREGNAPLQADAFKASRQEKQLEMGQMTRMEDRDPFETTMPGMTVAQHERYQKLISKRLQEDTDHSTAKAQADEKRRQSTEWRENEKPVREAVVNEYRNKPEVMADEFFRTSSLYGEKLESRPRLDADLLTPEQKAALPERFYSEEGIHPDDAAGLFGFPDGKSLVDSLIAFNLERVASALRPEEFKRRQINQEVQRRMEARYGNLRENILAEVKDRVASETQLQLLHEEVLALASDAKTEFSFTREQIKQWAADAVQKEDLWTLSSDKYFQDAGKAGRLAEDALLKGKPNDAYLQKQRQYLNILMAKEALQVEKDYAKFERTAKRFSRREVTGVNGEYVDYIQSLLAQAEIPGRRSVPELQAAVDARGYGSLDSFVQAKIAEGWEPAVSSEIIARGAKPLDKMTVQEFGEFKDSIDSLAHIGAAVDKVEVNGKQMEFEAVKQSIRDHLKQLPKRPAGSNKLRLGLDASLVRMEQLAKDLDLHEELGPFFNHVIRPIQEAKAAEYSKLDDLASRLKQINGFGKKWQKTLKDTIQNDFLYDPFDETNVPMTRESMINIMLNFGNRSNIEAFTRGWSQDKNFSRKQLDVKASQLEMRLRMMFDRFANKEDWDYVQHMWDTFSDWQKESAELSRRVSGVPPKWIPAEKINTPHGAYAGGYFPLIYDPIRSGIQEIKGKPQGTFTGNYFRATTNQGHLKERTGHVDYVKFDNTIEELGARMSQVIHDITHRQAVMDVGKIIYDKEIMADIRKHYGQEYEPQFDKWLKDVANHTNLDERAISRWNHIFKTIRMNLVNHALGLNLRVIGSPSLGTQNPLGIARDIVMKRFDPTMKNFAMENSLELKHVMRNLDRDYRERLEENIKTRGWAGVQAEAARWAFLPAMKIEEGLRVNTWIDKFQEARSRGVDPDDAIAIADSHVRIRHGASGVADLPAIMRHQNEMMKTLTMFYGYFNTTYNWQRELPSAAKRGDWKQAFAAAYGSVIVPSVFGALFFNQQKEGDSWFKVMAKALLLQPVQSIPGMRELGNYFIEGFPPRTPLESLMTALNSASKDVINFLNRRPVEKPISHAANVIGMGTGLPLAQVGRTGQFAYDVARDKQRPRTFAEWVRGIVNGEARLKR